MRIGTRMAARFDEHFREQGITQAQFRLLMAVHFQGGTVGIAPSALADHLLIERATVSVLVARLVEHNLIERRPGENRRTHCLILTPAGQQLLSQLAPQAIALAHEVLVGLSTDDLTQMRAILESLEAHIRGVTGQPTAPADAESP